VFQSLIVRIISASNAKKKGSVHKYMQRENEQRVIDHFSNLKLKDNKDEEINHLE
jgi:hypothetical protein